MRHCGYVSSSEEADQGISERSTIAGWDRGVERLSFSRKEKHARNKSPYRQVAAQGNETRPSSVITCVIISLEVIMAKLKVTTVGNSLGIILPKEVLRHLRLVKGDTLFALETTRGFELTPYDPAFEQQMDVAESVMREDRDVLRRLAR